MGPNRRAATLGWVLPLALLTLPNCGLNQGGIGPSMNVNSGAPPDSDVIFCDIQLPGGPGRHCASPMEMDPKFSIPLIHGAVALVERRSSDTALDYSLNSINNCNGDPEAVVFETPFPQGVPVCLNCGAVIPSKHANAQAVCEAKCADLAQPGQVPPLPQTLIDCAKLARPSTNVAVAPPPFCFANACSAMGNFLDAFVDVDPRRKTEPTTWTPLIGVAASGPDNNTLTRTAAFDNDFDAGASSKQTIDRRDAYVQFEATETDTARLGGLRQGAPSNVHGVAFINFAIDLFTDGCFYIFESGTKIVPTNPEPTAPGCSAPNAVGSYTMGDRFRIVVEGKFDGTSTAKITYQHIPHSFPCGQDQGLCSVEWEQTSVTTAQYPLRFDSALRELNASIGNVRLVRDRQ